MKKGLSNYQIDMQNSILWKAFDRKIEDKLKFLHLKKFTEYLSEQICLLMKHSLHSQIKNQKLLQAKKVESSDMQSRRELSYNDFKDEYNVMLKVNY